MEPFGGYVRSRREALRAADPSMSVRRVAGRIGVEPSFLSKVERGRPHHRRRPRSGPWPRVLGEDPDVLLALAGKVSGDLQAVIVKRPALFAQLIRELADAPDGAAPRVVREVRDGQW